MAGNDAQAVIDSLDALQSSLEAAASAAGDAGDVDKEAALVAQAHKVGQQLEAANQSLLAAIDSGKDVGDLLTQLGQLNLDLKAQQAAVDKGNADMDGIGAALEGVGKVVAFAKGMLAAG
jgi:hypothetical protein